MAKSTELIAFGAYQPIAFRFCVIFLNRKANSRVQNKKSGHGPHSPPGAAASPKRLQNIVFATQPVWAQIPDGQTSKVYPSENLV